MNKKRNQSQSGLSKGEKWFLLGGVHLALSSFVYYFNVRVFGEEDAAFYIAPLVVLAVVSLIAGRHIQAGNSTPEFQRKAFQVELSILGILFLNVVVSMMVLREMSLASQAEVRFDKNVESATKLRSVDAQDRLIGALVAGKSPTKTEVFQQKERILVGLLFLELFVAMGGGLMLVAYSIGDSDKNGKVDIFEEDEEEEEEMPARKGRDWKEFPA